MVKACGHFGFWSCRTSMLWSPRQIDRIAWNARFQSRRPKSIRVGLIEWISDFAFPSLAKLILRSKWRETDQGTSSPPPSLQVLLAKVLRALLVFISFAIALSTVGLTCLPLHCLAVQLAWVLDLVFKKLFLIWSVV